MKILLILLISMRVCFADITDNPQRYGFTFDRPKPPEKTFSEKYNEAAKKADQAKRREAYRLRLGNFEIFRLKNGTHVNGAPTKYLTNGVTFKLETGGYSDPFRYADFEWRAIDRLLSRAGTERAKSCVKPYVVSDVERKELEAQSTAMMLARATEAASNYESIKKANGDKAMQWNLSKAESGDAFGQFRMGERYRDGDGVTKDEAKAKEWLKKASDHGHKEAAAALAWLVAHPSSEPVAPASPTKRDITAAAP